MNDSYDWLVGFNKAHPARCHIHHSTTRLDRLLESSAMGLVFGVRSPG